MTSTEKQSLVIDPDVQILASISLALQPDYINPAKDPWATSPFAWIKTRPSRQRGKIGEQLIAGWCASKNLNVVRSSDSNADRVIEGRRVEIKFSTPWNEKFFKFQQIRDQNYDLLVCFGLMPFSAMAWVISKETLLKFVIRNAKYSQHGGRNGKDTAWLQVYPGVKHELLGKQSGTLDEVFEVLAGKKEPL